MRQRTWIILGKRNGKYIGYTEHSFSMGTSTSLVRVWRPIKGMKQFFKEKYEHDNEYTVAGLLKTVRRLQEREPGFGWRLYRVGTKNCPVKINWAKYHSLRNRKKFEYRNLEFIVKTGETGV